MAASRRKQDDRNLEILRELISLNGNKYCLDCNQRGPTYVNTTIGSFVCSKCSGMLRGLTPPHRVKSISMATFTPEEIEFIKARGNDYCRRVWLGLYEGESVNFTDEQSVKDFMSEKYEKKRYYLDPPLNNPSVTNGSSIKNKTKIKPLSSASINTPLISITPQITKSSNNNLKLNTAKIVNTPPDETSLKLARPINNFSQSALTNMTAAPASTPPISAPISDFPVDFSTANIYNSAQYNNNNFVSHPSSALTNFNSFNTSNLSTTSTNDRYAALADLDLALRQQNMKNMEESSNTNSKNPFQSTTTNDLFSNKNPFFISGWNSTTAMPVNPFMPSSNPTLGNSKNPFL